MKIACTKSKTFTYATVDLHAPPFAASVHHWAADYVDEFKWTIDDGLTVRAISSNNSPWKVCGVRRGVNQANEITVFVISTLRFEVSQRKWTTIVENTVTYSNDSAVIMEG